MIDRIEGHDGLMDEEGWIDGRRASEQKPRLRLFQVLDIGGFQGVSGNTGLGFFESIFSIVISVLY